MRKLLALLLVAPLVGCGDRADPEMDFGGEELGPDRHAVLSEEGKVKMGLTDRYVYFALSDSTVAAARDEMRSDLSGDGEVTEAFAEEQVREFAAAFRRVKAEGAEGGP